MQQVQQQDSDLLDLMAWDDEPVEAVDGPDGDLITLDELEEEEAREEEELREEVVERVLTPVKELVKKFELVATPSLAHRVRVILFRFHRRLLILASSQGALVWSPFLCSTSTFDVTTWIEGATKKIHEDDHHPFRNRYRFRRRKRSPRPVPPSIPVSCR